MVCECGSHDTVIEGGVKWCTGCGAELERRCEWTFTYALCHNYRKVPIYSRIKRFRVWLQELNKPLIFANFERILMLYGQIEFSWEPRKTTRTYFFNKNCVLSFILEHLGIECKVPTLKDNDRVQKQVKTMKALLIDLKKNMGI